MGVDRVAFGVQPGLAGVEGVVALARRRGRAATERHGLHRAQLAVMIMQSARTGPRSKLQILES